MISNFPYNVRLPSTRFTYAYQVGSPTNYQEGLPTDNKTQKFFTKSESFCYKLQWIEIWIGNYYLGIDCWTIGLNGRENNRLQSGLPGLP